jgi:hypothetical protein
MKMQDGEILDRLSILCLKVTNIVQGDQFIHELAEYIRELQTIISSEVASALASLIRVNSEIWNLEADIRQHKELELGLEEVGRRALAIRDLNEKRVELKNSVSIFKESKLV